MGLWTPDGIGNNRSICIRHKVQHHTTQYSNHTTNIPQHNLNNDGRYGTTQVGAYSHDCSTLLMMIIGIVLAVVHVHSFVGYRSSDINSHPDTKRVTWTPKHTFGFVPKKADMRSFLPSFC